MNETIDYYNQNADAFASGTVNVDFTEVQDKFLSYLPSGAYILDFGCGSGRDTKYFLSKGFQVEATDGSEELCKIAAKTAGISVKQMLFSELNEKEKYDGIWACSSILHHPKDELKGVMVKILRAIKDAGYIYTSFKYGESEGYRNGRYFTDYTEESFAEFLRDFPQLKITEEWVSRDARPGRGDEKWLNLILKKSDTV
jgi:SAM-dependent methyltransferase